MKKRIIALLLAVVMVAAFVGCKTESKEDAKLTIGICQLVEHGALDNAREGFIQALADNGYVDGENIVLDVQNAQNDQSNLSTIGDRFVSENCDLILAIATGSAQAMAGKTTNIPILATAVTDYETANLVNSNAAPGGNVSGTTDMNPITEQIDLVVKLVPEAKTIGCIYNGGEANSVLQAELAKAAIEAKGLTYTEITVTSTNDVQQAVSTLAGQCDAIYIPTDNTLASSMPVVYGVTAETKTPVICGESSMVLAGGLATLGINYYNLGYQTGLMAVRILKDSAVVSDMPVESQTDFDYVINGQIASEIGLAIPEDLQQYVVEPEA